MWKRHQRYFQLACLGSGMKWFRKDIDEYFKEAVNWWKKIILSTSKETFDFEIATNKFIGRCELFPAHHGWGWREKALDRHAYVTLNRKCLIVMILNLSIFFINVMITFVNIKMFIFQPFLLKNKNVLDHTIWRRFLSQLYNYITAITKIKMTITTTIALFSLTNTLNSLSNWMHSFRSC